MIYKVITEKGTSITNDVNNELEIIKVVKPNFFEVISWYWKMKIFFWYYKLKYTRGEKKWMK